MGSFLCTSNFHTSYHIVIWILPTYSCVHIACILPCQLQTMYANVSIKVSRQHHPEQHVWSLLRAQYFRDKEAQTQLELCLSQWLHIPGRLEKKHSKVLSSVISMWLSPQILWLPKHTRRIDEIKDCNGQTEKVNILQNC